MEEVDKILIQSLRDIDCQIDSSCQKISEFDVNTLFACVSQCLQLITGEKNLPKRLPPNISTRFKICGELAQLCQSIGYKGDVGYQIFISINENETRKLLNFLIEKVPREVAVTVASTSLDPWEALNRIISNKITTELSTSTWIPHDLVVDLCNVPFHHPAASFAQKSGFTPTNRSQMISLHVPPQNEKTSNSFVFEQIPLKDLANSLFYENQVSCWLEKQSESRYLIPGQKLEHKLTKEIRQKIDEGDRLGANYEYSNRNETKKRHDDLLLTRSRFMHTNTSVVQENGNEENVKRTIDQTEELERLKSTIAENEETIDQLEAQLKKIDESIKKYEKFTEETNAEIENLSKDLQVKQKAANYLLSIDPETERLQNAIEKSKTKLKTLENQWIDVRSGLIDQRDRLLQQLNERQAKLNEKLQQINEMKAKGAALINETKEKDQQLNRLQQEYENHKSSISKNDQSRTFFTKQILEIVHNTNKQKEEISKTNIEIRGLQKDLNRLTEKLERTFHVADGLLFKDVKSDDCARRSYKMLVAFHSDCEAIYKIVEEIGLIIREVREGEDQIEVESQKNMTTNLQTLTEEFKKIRDENIALRGGKK